MRSASPPAGTAGGAGIAEASPVGEKSGRGADTGPSQDGETPTVNQSREWPFRDTAPRQDPAEARLDPIWGTDPPDAVRWHMDMNADQEPNASRSPTRQPEPPHDPAADGRSSPSSLPSAFAPPSPETDRPSSTLPSTGASPDAGESEATGGRTAVPTLRSSDSVGATEHRPEVRELATQSRSDAQVTDPSEQAASQADPGDRGQGTSGPAAQGTPADRGHGDSGTPSPPDQGLGGVRAGEAATVLAPPGAGSTGSGTSSGGSGSHHPNSSANDG